MTDDLSKVPRRMRRFYRHGESIPGENETNSREPTHEENEPWMGAHEAPPSRRGSRRNEAPEKNQPASSENSSGGLFGKLMGSLSKPRTTHVDHALGLGEKQSFEERPPNQSEKAMQGKPPQGKTTPEMQAALNELQQLAQKETRSTSKPQASVSLSSFHFTPAGEAPRAPQTSGESSSAPAQTPATGSPRERMEQRRKEREANVPPSNPSASASNQAKSSTSNVPAPAHIRRRMGQLNPQEERMEENPAPTSSAEKDSPSGDDEDFKSLFGSTKNKKKKKTGNDDEDFSLDSDLGDDEELPLFEDEK